MNEARTMTSLDVSAITGVDHSQVVNAIRDMEPAWERVKGKKFRKTPDDVFMLSKVESFFVAAKFTQDEKDMLVIYWGIFD